MSLGALQLSRMHSPWGIVAGDPSATNHLTLFSCTAQHQSISAEAVIIPFGISQIIGGFT